MEDILTRIIREAGEILSYANMMLDDIRAGLETAAKDDMLSDMESQAWRLLTNINRAQVESKK